MNAREAAVECVLETPYLRLAGLRWGRGRARRVLALHGWLDNAASFATLAPRLPDCDVVALDLTGHGHSQHRPPGVIYHIVDFVPDAVAAADALGWERFVLLGHSMGAGIAGMIAAILPERVAALAMIDGIGPLTGKPEDDPARLALSVRQMQRHAQGRRPPVYADLEAAVAARCRAGEIDADAARAIVSRALVPCDGGYTWCSDPRLLYRSPVYLTEPQVLAFLARIACPAQLLEAERGVLVDRPETATRRATVRGLDYRRLAGGHHLHLEQPDRVAGPLRAFLDRTDSG